MKKTLAILLPLCLLAGLLTGCGAKIQMPESKSIRVVTTIFPLYDWLREIVGEAENVELTMLFDNGVDMHSYQPNAQDLVSVSSCDLFVYVGGASDGWVGDAVESVQNPDRIAVNLLESLGDAVKKEELVEGMQAEDEEDGTEYDEHVWLSLRNAAAMCRLLSEKLGAVDPQNAGLYTKNTENYTAKLAALDHQYEVAVEGSENKMLLFADRFPFRYMADDYGLTYFAAFAGCSAETEASFKTILFLAGKVDALGLDSILQIESADGSVARTVRENTKTKDQQILTMNSLQSVTAQDVENGISYLSVMTKNLETLKTALG